MAFHSKSSSRARLPYTVEETTNDSTRAVELWEINSANGPQDPQSLYVRNASIESLTECGTRCNTARCNSRLKSFIPLFIVLAASAGVSIAVALYVTNTSDSSTFFLHRANVSMRVDETFQPEMVNPASLIFEEYARRFCYNILTTLAKKLTVTDCAVNNLRNGSVIVDFEMEVQTSSNLTQHELQKLVVESGEARGAKRLFRNIQVFGNSIEIFSLSSTNDTFSKPHVQTSGEFDCSQPGHLFRAYSYTYPAFCGEFQLCGQDRSIPLVCEKGLEFGYEANSIRDPCRRPSNQSYCGQKRLEEYVTVSVTFPPTNSEIFPAESTSSPSLSFSSKPSSPSSLDNLISSSTTEMKVSALTMALTNETVTSAKTYEELKCSHLDPLLLTDDPSLYTCPHSGFTVRPQNNTYPFNCLAYTWCLQGRAVEAYCAEGTVFLFILGTTPYCGWSNHPNSFCGLKEVAAKCKVNSVKGQRK